MQSQGCSWQKVTNKALGTEKACSFMVIGGHFHTQSTMRDFEKVNSGKKIRSDISM